MKTIPPSTVQRQNKPPEPDLYEVLKAKHWFLDLLDSIPSPHEVLYRTLLEAGYAAIRIERLATHPVWEIRATMPQDAPATDRRLLKRQLRSLLKAANLPVKSDDIIVMPAGRRIHVTFVQRDGQGVVMATAWRPSSRTTPQTPSWSTTNNPACASDSASTDS